MMKAKYKKYYDALKGKNFSSGISKMSSAVDATETGIAQMQSSMSASGWTELGAMTINNTTIPNMVLDVRMIKSNITGALTQAVTKVTELVSQLTELESLENEKDALGEKWTYTEGGSHTQSEVSSHNNKIDELERKITEKESACDGVIEAINGIKVEMVKPSINITSVAADNSVLTKDDTSTAATVSDGSIASKKAAFLGSVDDPKNYDTVPANFRNMRKTMQLFDNTTGEIIQDHGTIHLKPGETRVITVKLPTNTGMIQEIHRTTADGNGAYRSGNIVTAKSDVDPDPNVIDYVNYKSWSNHWPKNRAGLHNNSYDWVITAKADGSVQCSQTCEYTTSVSKGGNMKAMINLNVVVSS